MQDTKLDEFIMENGKELDQDIQVLSKEETDKKFDDNFQILYDKDTPIPGGNVIHKISGLETINEQTALDSLIIKSAMIKAEKEKKEEQQRNKLTKKDRDAVKKQFVDSLMYQQEEDYYQKHHYIMDGKTKRGTRKRIERDFDKGRYDRFLMQDRKSLNG